MAADHILDFETFDILTPGGVERVNMRDLAKFHRYRDIAIFSTFKMAAVRRVGF